MSEKPKNDIDDLRTHLFETLRSLKGEVKPVELERAKAVCDVAGKIIDSARVEVSFLKATQSASGSDFFFANSANSKKLLDQQPTRPALLKNGKGQDSQDQRVG